MAPNGTKTKIEGGKNASPTEAPEAARTPEAAKSDWEAELEKLSPDEQIEILREIHREAKRFLDMDEEERATLLRLREEEEGNIGKELEFLDLSPEARKAKLEENRRRAEDAGEKMAKIRRETGAYFVTIRAEAEKRRRDAESQELKELMTENSEELIDLFMAALKDGNATRCAAIMRKLTADANENELLNFFGYPSNIDGLHRFTAEVMIGRKSVKTVEGKYELGGKIYTIPGTKIKPLNLSPQTAYAIENDISYIAESKRHWGVARAVEQHFGQFYQATEEEQAGAVVAELAKSNVQTMAREFNRLAFGGEVPRQAFNPSAGRVFRISRSGLAVLMSMAGMLEGYAVKGEYNANAARNFAGIKKDLIAAGIRPSFIEALEEYAEKKIEPDLGAAVRRAVHAPLPPISRI